MEKTGVQKLAYVLKVLVTAVFICNLLVLPLVPGLVASGHDGIPLDGYFRSGGGGLAQLWESVQTMGEYGAVLTAFLFSCGVGTAVLIWQARRVLGTIGRQTPFCRENEISMRCAAVCCFCIAAASLARTVWGFAFFRSLRPIFTYNALFCPIFLLAGLLCLVVSALFRQATELREESDLTI